MRERLQLTVDAGGVTLAAGVWRAAEGAPTVLAIHGITATHMSWPLVAERLPGMQLIAPDLRGRGRSASAQAPWTMVQHADDMARVLDELGVERATVVGHSMGAFVAAWFASRHPDRTNALVLLDGGLPLPFQTPPDVSPEQLPALLLGPAGERLTRLYESREQYMHEWRQHPAFKDNWNDTVAAYVEYDLQPAPGGYRTRTRLDPVATNIVEMDGGGGYREALRELRGRVDFLHAPRGLLDGEPLYPGDVKGAYGDLIPGLVVHEVPDVNHYGLVMTASGADHVAAVVAAETG